MFFVKETYLYPKQNKIINPNENNDAFLNYFSQISAFEFVSK